MIPADVASRLQVSADAAQRPVAPAQEIVDKLPGLVAGQKVMAEIQSLLPNGTYRALINQRSITLALPFSAKSGDALELQVTESNGKLALAVVSRPGGEGAQPGATASATTLSRTGQLISTLFSGARQAEGNGTATPLNSNQPISSGPTSAQDLLPMLKQAIAQSGMFYESHQAEWIEGRFAKSALLQEPQGKLSSPSAFAQDAAAAAQSAEPSANAALVRTLAAGESGGQVRTTAEGGTPASTAEASKTGVAQQTTQPGQLIAPQTQPLVQQQLEALATQNFSWQGQIWPGQEMRWEIDEDGRQRGLDDEENDSAAKWTTRLHLNLPNLGEVDAQIRLQGNQITLSMSADNEPARALMRSASLALRSQLDEAGIALASMGIAASESSGNKDDGQAGA